MPRSHDLTSNLGQNFLWTTRVNWLQMTTADFPTPKKKGKQKRDTSKVLYANGGNDFTPLQILRMFWL